MKGIIESTALMATRAFRKVLLPDGFFWGGGAGAGAWAGTGGLGGGVAGLGGGGDAWTGADGRAGGTGGAAGFFSSSEGFCWEGGVSLGSSNI